MTLGGAIHAIVPMASLGSSPLGEEIHSSAARVCPYDTVATGALVRILAMTAEMYFAAFGFNISELR